MSSEKDLLKQIALLGELLNEHKRSQIANATNSAANNHANSRGRGRGRGNAPPRGPAPAGFPHAPARAPRQPAYQTRPGRASFPRGSHNLSLVNAANGAVNSPNNPIGNAPPRSPNLTLVNPQPHKNAISQSTTQPAPLNTLAPPAAPPRPPSAPPSPHRKLDTRAAPLAPGAAFPVSARSPTVTLRGPSAAPAIAPVRPPGFPQPRPPFSAGQGRPRPFGKRGGYQARQGRRKLLAQAAGAQQQEEAKKAAQLHKGKKIKVVSIAGALFDVSDDGQYLVRRIKSTVPPAASARVSLRGMSYRRTDPNTYKRIDLPKKEYCMFYNRFGECKNGSACPFVHDKTKVAVCLKFLRGACDNADCPLSHTADQAKMPMCMYFVRGRCDKGAECVFAHVQVAPDAPVCQDFVKGYCPRGFSCTDKHTWECPSFAESGACPAGDKCRLQHKSRRPQPAAEPSAMVPAAFRTRPQHASSDKETKVKALAASSHASTLAIKPDFHGDRMLFRSDDTQVDDSSSVGEANVQLSIRPSFARDAAHKQ